MPHLTAIADEPPWQDVSSCPHDGLFIVYEDGAIRTMYRSQGEWQATAMALDTWGQPTHLIPVRETGVYEPTHWMPLPAPPRTTEQVAVFKREDAHARCQASLAVAREALEAIAKSAEHAAVTTMGCVLAARNALNLIAALLDERG